MRVVLEDALIVHEAVLKQEGGSAGIREIESLEAALARPFGGFGDHEFYPTPEEKAAAILESVLLNHPFVDGNKRTGYVLMRMILKAYNRDIAIPENDRYDFVIQVASGNLSFEEIVTWIRNAVAPK